MPLKSVSFDRHLTVIDVAALLEGRLSLEEREALLRHVGGCARCSAWLAEAYGVAAAGEALPPVAFYHPLERFLAPLRRVRPWPVWVWHLLLQALIPVLWVLVVDVREVPHLESPFWTFAPWPSSLLMTTYLLWQQGWFRRFARQMWEAGIPALEVELLLRRHLAPVQGWPYGGGWLFVGLGVLMTLSNALLMPAAAWKTTLVVGLIGLYGAVVTMAMYWSWGWGGWWWYGVAKVLTSYQEQARSLLPQARGQALTWLLVASVSMMWHLAVYVHLTRVHLALRLYGVIITFLLFSLWSGYVVLERALVYEGRGSIHRGWALLRVGVALLFTLVPIGVMV